MYLIDQHQDTFLHLRHKDFFPEGEQINWQMLKARPSMACMTVYPDGTNWDNPEFNLDVTVRMKSYIDELKKNKFSIVLNAGDIKKVVLNKEHAALLHIEGLNSFTGSKEDWNILYEMHNLGLRSIGIVWNLNNSLGGGTQDEEGCGLTNLGFAMLDWMVNEGVVIDMAHMNEQTFYDVAEFLQDTDLPLYVSHGNARAVCDSPRNYSDEQLQMIANSGGTIGVFFSGKYLNEDGEASCDTIVEHISYIATNFGVDHVSIGTDLGGITTYIPKHCGSFDKLSNIEKILSERGFSQEDIEKIFYKNALRVLSAHLA